MDKSPKTILLLFIALAGIAFLQIILFECFQAPSASTLLPKFHSDNLQPKTLQYLSSSSSTSTKTATTTATKTATTTKSKSKSSLRSLEEILERAGVDVTQEIKEQLPPMEDVQSMYGSEPIIHGLDTCQAFQNTIESSDAFIAPAGMFNTGTNLLQTLLTQNCYIPDRITKHGKGNAGIRFQVPWGKHSPVSWRYKHAAPSATKLNQTQFLPAVVIKDPYTWMDSMCRHSYAANWKHFEGHCPNLVPNSESERAFLKDKLSDSQTLTTFPVNIRYHETNMTHHESLIDLWNTWYGDWMNVTFPRLVVRFEDLLFHAEAVVEQICECGGGKIYNMTDFKYSVDSAKQGAAHKGANGLVKSIVKYSDKSKRVKSFASEDLEYATKTVKMDIMDIFNYAKPQM